MSVEIVPRGYLSFDLPCGNPRVEAAGDTVEQVLERLGVRLDLVSIVLINGQQSTMETILRDGDVVQLIPFVVGG